MEVPIALSGSAGRWTGLRRLMFGKGDGDDSVRSRVATAAAPHRIGAICAAAGSAVRDSAPPPPRWRNWLLIVGLILSLALFFLPIPITVSVEQLSYSQPSRTSAPARWRRSRSGPMATSRARSPTERTTTFRRRPGPDLAPDRDGAACPAGGDVRFMIGRLTPRYSSTIAVVSHWVIAANADRQHQLAGTPNWR